MSLKPATAIRKFFSTDCCHTGKFYPPVSVPEIKEFKDACGPVEYSELGQAVIKHLEDHEIDTYIKSAAPKFADHEA